MSLDVKTQNRSRLYLCGVLAFMLLHLGDAMAVDTNSLIRQYCVDCHGDTDSSPEGGVSLSIDFDSASLVESGHQFKNVLDAIEGFEMPPVDAEQPTAKERSQLVSGIRHDYSGWPPGLDTPTEPRHPALTPIRVGPPTRKFPPIKHHCQTGSAVADPVTHRFRTEHSCAESGQLIRL